MDASRMTDAQHRLTRWLTAQRLDATSLSSNDIHIDELFETSNAVKLSINLAVQLLEHSAEFMLGKLANHALLLIVALKPSDVMQPKAPEWNEIDGEIGATPPAIYLMSRRALAQPFIAERYLHPVMVPEPNPRGFRATYNCWRWLDDPPDEGWTRDIRIEYEPEEWFGNGTG